MHPIRRPYLHLALLLPLMCYAAYASAAIPATSAMSIPPSIPLPAMNPGVQALNRMQIYASQAIADAIEAQSAQHEKNIVELDAELTKVQVMLELIRSRMPGAEFLAMVRAMRAKMNFEDNQQVQPFFSYLFYALDDLGSSSTVKKARKYLKKAQNALAIPNRANALIALRKSEATFENPLISPSLKAATENLQQAFSALNVSNEHVSDSLLKALVNHLEALHKAFATYPLGMPPGDASTQH